MVIVLSNELRASIMVCLEQFHEHEQRFLVKDYPPGEGYLEQYLLDVGRQLLVDLSLPTGPADPEALREFMVARVYAPSPALRLQVMTRDGFRCVLCGTDQELTIDHRVPFSKGGLSVFENLQTACWPCNSRKGAK